MASKYRWKNLPPRNLVKSIQDMTESSNACFNDRNSSKRETSYQRPSHVTEKKTTQLASLNLLLLHIAKGTTNTGLAYFYQKDCLLVRDVRTCVNIDLQDLDQVASKSWPKFWLQIGLNARGQTHPWAISFFSTRYDMRVFFSIRYDIDTILGPQKRPSF